MASNTSNVTGGVSSLEKTTASSDRSERSIGFDKYTDIAIRIAKNPDGLYGFMQNESYIGYFLSRGESWEKFMSDIYRRFDLKEKTVINAGAHIGTHAVILAKLAKHVFLFEPQKVMYWILRANLINNREGDGDLNLNFTTFNKALGHGPIREVTLGDVDFAGEINYTTQKSVNYGGVALGKGNVTTEMTSVDLLDQTHNNGIGCYFGDVGLILFDLEGAENAAFYGARGVIQRCRPIIIFESNHKKITPEMKAICGFSDEACAFSIVKFTYETLSYNPPVKISNDDVLLLPLPERIILPEKKYDSGFTLEMVTDEIYGMQRLVFHRAGRKNAKISWLYTNVIVVEFPDDTNRRAYVGTIDDGGRIIWGPNNVWNPIREPALTPVPPPQTAPLPLYGEPTPPQTVPLPYGDPKPEEEKESASQEVADEVNYVG